MTDTGEVTIEVLLTVEERRDALIQDARRGLTATPKTLSPVWFYDEHGSNLFDDITRLPEYYLTRAERGLLDAHAEQIVAAAEVDTLVELGSGTADKTGTLLDAMANAGTLRRFVPFDVSEETLRGSAWRLARAYPGTAVHAIVGDFHRHLDGIPGGGRRLVAFLGSTIGNFAPAERQRFLSDLNGVLAFDDRILLGADLVKDPARLLAAYDDAGGVTAAFNRNALRVLNRELRGRFEPQLYEHDVKWDAEREWIEMHLRATSDHTVALEDLDLDIHFERGETLRTEISAKFTPAGISAELDAAGFVVEHTWNASGEFLLVLARPRRAEP